MNSRSPQTNIPSDHQPNEEENGASAYVLSCISALYERYPGPVDTTTLVPDESVAELGASLLGVFARSGILSGPHTRMVLTAAGHEALAADKQAPGGLARLLSGETVDEPDKVLLVLLRLAFETQTELFDKLLDDTDDA